MVTIFETYKKSGRLITKKAKEIKPERAEYFSNSKI